MDTCKFRETIGFGRAADAAERNGRNDRMIEEFGKNVVGVREKKRVNLRKVFVLAGFVTVK